jgi:methionyl-tRNA formyltransferase
MNLVFMGTPYFAVPSLQKLVESQHFVRGVVTQPDKPQGRGRVVSPSPVKVFAQEKGIPVQQPVDLLDPGFLKWLRPLAPDLIVVVAFRILPPEIISLPGKGCVNLHASLLPAYRGAAPIQWAIINGEKQTGLTTFLIEEKVDTGQILLQQEVDILAHETSGELAERMKYLGADLLLETINRLGQGQIKPQPQRGPAGHRAPKLTKEDGRIDWAADAGAIYNRIRGLNPAPGAYTYLNGSLLKIHRAEAVPANGAIPRAGEIVETGQQLVVACGKDQLVLKEVQLAGKKRMGVEEFLRGIRLERGVQLGK